MEWYPACLFYSAWNPSDTGNDRLYHYPDDHPDGDDSDPDHYHDWLESDKKGDHDYPDSHSDGDHNCMECNQDDHSDGSYWN